MRLYTLAEARLMLPQVIPVLEQLCEAIVALRALQAAVAAELRGASGDGASLANPWESDPPESRAQALNQQLRTASRQLETWGIEVKDPERGLIDFHHDRYGEVVYLCYLLGEPDIGWWHRIADGFAGRVALEE